MDTLICGGGLVSKILHMTLGTSHRPRYPLHPQNNTKGYEVRAATTKGQNDHALTL